MTIAEIRELEGSRNESGQFNVVHFVKEGNGFFRAHDWSAWLLKQFPPNDVIADMSVTAKRLKDGYVDAFVGFPATSLKKYIPDAESSSFSPVDDNHFTVTVEIPAEIGEVSFDNLNKMKEEWKESLPLQNGKKERREEREVSEQAPRIVRLSDLASRLVSLPMEDLSPREAWDILRDLRKQASALF